jgi:hypothetical protein
MKIDDYIIATQEADHEDGYPEYEDSADSSEGLKAAAKRAEDYGVPIHRLTVTAYWTTEHGKQHDILGNLEEVLRTVSPNM